MHGMEEEARAAAASSSSSMTRRSSNDKQESTLRGQKRPRHENGTSEKTRQQMPLVLALFDASSSSEEEEEVDVDRIIPKRARLNDTLPVWTTLLANSADADANADAVAPSWMTLLNDSEEEEEAAAPPPLLNILSLFEQEEEEEDNDPRRRPWPILYAKAPASGIYWVLEHARSSRTSSRLQISVFSQHEEDEPVFHVLATLAPRHLQGMVLWDLMRHPFGTRSNLYLSDHQLHQWPHASPHLHALLTLDEDQTLPHATSLYGLRVPSAVLPMTRQEALLLMFRPHDDGLLLYAPHGLHMAFSLPTDRAVNAALCIRTMPHQWEYKQEEDNSFFSLLPDTLWWLDGSVWSPTMDAASIVISLWSPVATTCALFQLTSQTECPLLHGREHDVTMLFQPWPDFALDRAPPPPSTTSILAQHLGLLNRPSPHASSSSSHLSVSAGILDFRQLETLTFTPASTAAAAEATTSSSSASASVTSSSEGPVPDIEHLLTLVRRDNPATIEVDFQLPEYEREYGPLYRFMSVDGQRLTLVLQGMQPAPGVFQLELRALLGKETLPSSPFLPYQAASSDIQSVLDKMQRYHGLWRRVCKTGMLSSRTPKNMILEVMKLAYQMHQPLQQAFGRPTRPKQPMPLPAAEPPRSFKFMLRRSQQHITMGLPSATGPSLPPSAAAAVPDPEQGTSPSALSASSSF